MVYRISYNHNTQYTIHKTLFMKIAIIGAGFTGLSAAYELTKYGNEVVIYESGDKPGGLASGFKKEKWDYSLDEHYHHIFTNDNYFLDLAKEVGQEVEIKRPITSLLYKNKSYQLDSPIELLKFPHLSVFGRLRTGMVLAFLKVNPFWKVLEGITAERFLRMTMGNKSWEILWKPLFDSKFGVYASEVSASWFWARIKKRTTRLGYPKGGFVAFAQKLEEKIQKNNGKLIYKTQVTKIINRDNGFSVYVGANPEKFDKVIVTSSAKVLSKLVDELPSDYLESLTNLKSIGAVNAILSLDHKFFTDNTYWLSINDSDNPFVALVEHTNFIDKKNYNNEHLLYIGNYKAVDDELFDMDESELIELFIPHLKKINSKFKKSWIKGSWVFKAKFAQPIFPLNYSKNLLTLKTPIDGLYLANMQMVYPWDRGTNYAIELGNKVAKLVNGR